MIRNLLVTAVLVVWPACMQAQINARLFQHPDVSETHITFAYAGDIWVVPKSGGTAAQLSSPPGPEQFPRFSPDGSTIAFSGNYNGNVDVYTIPLMGGIPERITFHGMTDRVVGWHPVEDKILFASSRKSGRQRFNQFYLISAEGGMAEKLPLPHAEFGSFSPEGGKIAYTDKTRLSRTWKRYRGGMAPDLILFDLEQMQSEYITETSANEELPMWAGNRLYFLSDRGAEKRFNIWSYDFGSGEVSQLTRFSEYDVHWPSMGPSEIVFEAGGKLYLLGIDSGEVREVAVQVVTDLRALTPRPEKVASLIAGAALSPDGKRVAVNARGELFTVPAEHGYIKNLTGTSGVAERLPAWSPDGKSILYWSDRSGEYELMRMDTESGDAAKLTGFGPGFRYRPYWSPDSKKAAFIDQSMKIWVLDMEEEEPVQIDQGLWMNHGALRNFRVSWSSDSRWIAWSRDLANRAGAIFLHDTESGRTHRVTGNFYSHASPVFDPDGKYLFLLTNRNFNPVYSDFGNEFVYPNATHLAAVSLRSDVPSLLAPRNDEVSAGDDGGDSGNGEKKADGEDGEEENGEEAVEIDLEDFEERMVILPPAPGNYSHIEAAAGKVIYHHHPNSGSREKKRPVKYFDLEEREEKTIVEDADGYSLAAGGGKMLVALNGKLSVVDVAEGQKPEKPLRTDDMEMELVPGEEYRQIFMDAWRFERDYFYDEGMHGVDWNLMKERYGSMLEDAVTRWDVNYILGEMIGELNASHTYRGGGDTEKPMQRNVGYLGVDWTIRDGAYQIAAIIEPAPWETDARSPLSLPGVEVSAGDYLLAVNGTPLDVSKEPYAAFQGLAGSTVELTVTSDPGSADTRKVVVELLKNETRLRHLAWIEQNRSRVEEATGGRAGYIYVRSTGVDGQNELVRQFAPQFTKDALIIDERFNSGGQIPDRFIELLDRAPLAYWAVRDGPDWRWPPTGHFGPKVMLINGWSGSGGDAFPDYFRKAGLGPLVGSRTWGGLIGISGSPRLIDGGMVTVPTFRMFNPDGEWFREGHGVEPDIGVREDAGRLARGTDVQLERAIGEILRLLEEQPYVKPAHPPVEER